MPRKKKSDAPTALSETLEVLKEKLDLKTADQLEPTFVEKVRGPRKRSPDEMANIFASKEIRLGRDGNTYQLQAERDLTSAEMDYAARNGFAPVDDESRVWNATQREVNRAGGDPNAVAYRVGKGEGRGR